MFLRLRIFRGVVAADPCQSCATHINTLTLSWRGPLSYRNHSMDLIANQWTGFYMITASVMRELSSFFPTQCFKKTSSNSKYNGFICFLLFSYLRSLKAKYRSLVICKIIRVVDKDRQLAWTSVLNAMMMLKKSWGEVTEQTIRNCFRKSVRCFIGRSRRCYGWPWWPISRYGGWWWERQCCRGVRV